jgi:hypothetical protein
LVTEPQGVVVSVVRHEDLDAALTAFLFRRYGVGDLEGVEGATDRVIELAPSSTVVCPLHHRRLIPDGCRSCSFLSGEVPRP